MKRLQNVLYILTPDSYLYRQGECICVKVGGEERVRVPSHTIESIIFFGNTTVTTPMIQFCGENGITITFLDDYGRFQGRFYGPTKGNVLLRKRQYMSTEDDRTRTKMVCNFVAAKIANSRNTLLRSAREQPDLHAQAVLRQASDKIAEVAEQIDESRTVDILRGIEGIAASIYFDVFEHMIRVNKEDFKFKGRNRRPPEDNMNALISFLYMLLKNDMCAAVEALGLDPAVGWLHALRPGRPSLALDMMEELRSPLCDRLALSLVNLKQLQGKDFEAGSEGIKITDKGRKTILNAWQERKKETLLHPFLNEKIQIGLIPYVQAQLLSKYLRGDLDAYPPFYWK